MLEEITLGECATNCIFDGPTLYVTATKVADLGFGQTHRHVLERRDRRDRRPAADPRQALDRPHRGGRSRARARTRGRHRERGERVGGRAGTRAGRRARGVQEAAIVDVARVHGARAAPRRPRRGRGREGRSRDRARAERDVRRLHVERVERRGCSVLQATWHGAEAAAREAQEHRDGVVQARSAGGRRARAGRCLRSPAPTPPGPASAIWRSMSWLASSNSRPPLAAGSANHAAALARGRRRAPSVGPKLRLTSRPGCGPRRSAAQLAPARRASATGSPPRRPCRSRCQAATIASPSASERASGFSR